MTNIPEFVAGSFRDPNGRVFEHQGRIYRTISKSAVDDFNAVVESGLYDELIRDGLLVGWSKANKNDFDLEDDIAVVIEQEKLPFVSYPYEWSFGALKAAALCHLDVQLRALQLNVVLSDATAYNVMFVGSRPIFIDYLSFRPYRDGEFWLAHQQFCEQFLNPLLMSARLGVNPNAWYRGNLEGVASQDLATLLGFRGWLNGTTLINTMLPSFFERRATTKNSNAETVEMVQSRKLAKSAYQGMIKRLHAGISKLSVTTDTTVWQDYANNTSYSSEETTSKEVIVARFTNTIKPAILWDIGCNTGRYSKLALENGAANVIGLEFDTGALETAYAMSKREQLAFTPLLMNAVNPSPALGWNECERHSLKDRANAEAIIALAIIHHICIGRNIPLSDAVNWFVDLAPSGLIEFVPKEDPMVQELLSLREDIFPDYTYDAFCTTLSKKAAIKESETVNAHGRRLVWFSRFN